MMGKELAGGKAAHAGEGAAVGGMATAAEDAAGQKGQ